MITEVRSAINIILNGVAAAVAGRDAISGLKIG